MSPDGPAPARRRPLGNLWRIRRYVRPYARHLALMLVVSLAEVGAGIAVPLVIQHIIDGPVRRGQTSGLLLLGALALALGAGEAGMDLTGRWVHARAAVGMETAIRNDFYRHLQRLPVSFHDRWQTGQLVARLTTDLDAIRRFLGFGLVFGVVTVVIYATVAALLVGIHWPLGLVVVAGTLPLLLICRRLERHYLRLARQVQDQQGDLATFVEESAGGIRTIRAFGRRRFVGRRFAAAARTLHNTSVAKTRVVARFEATITLVSNTLLGIVLLFGALAVVGGRLTLGELVAFITLMWMLSWPVDALGWILANAQEAATAADRLYEVFDTPPAIVDRPGAVNLRTARGHLRFEGVAFRYPGAAAPVLRDVHLDVRPGETLAVVGLTGSGKTTLTALVPRLWDVTAGRVTLDGHDIRDLRLDALRRLVSVGFEDPTLFSASVRENLTLGRPDATDDEIDEALGIAQAGFVHDLPWGMDTRIGEQGLSLSGGQRQRLALARAVLGRPAVLVLDDPLSALDVHTESLVEGALARVLADTTALLVVHRPSTVALADRVALLAGGTVTAVGTHSELLATVPAYRAVLSGDTGGPAPAGGRTGARRAGPTAGAGWSTRAADRRDGVADPVSEVAS